MSNQIIYDAIALIEAQQAKVKPRSPQQDGGISGEDLRQRAGAGREAAHGCEGSGGKDDRGVKKLNINNQKLAVALRRMAPKTGSIICQGCGYEHNCFLHGCAVLREAAERLAELSAASANQPLTLEELRKMDGEPVWVERVKNGSGEWGIAEGNHQICRLTCHPVKFA